MKMLTLALIVAIVGPAYAQEDGHIPGLDKPTDCVMTRIKSIQGRLEGQSLRESGAAVEYENGAHGVQYQLGDSTPTRTNPGTASIGSKRHMKTISLASRVGDPIKLCLVFVSRCIAPRAMVVGENILRSICAITNGGTKATANTCAGEHDDF